MHAGAFEANWNSEGLMARHRAVVSGAHRGQGLEVTGLDWACAHHERGPEIDAAKHSYDYVQGPMSRYQRLVTAAVANAERVDGLAVEVQFLNYRAEVIA